MENPNIFRWSGAEIQTHLTQRAWSTQGEQRLLGRVVVARRLDQLGAHAGRLGLLPQLGDAQDRQPRLGHGRNRRSV